MTDIQGVLAGWEEARTNLGRKGSLKTIELRTAGQKVADALREMGDDYVHRNNFDNAMYGMREAESALAACLERETAVLDLLNEADAEHNEPRVAWGLVKKAHALLASSVGVGAVATVDGKA